MTDVEIVELKHYARLDAEHHGHSLLPWMDSPFPAVGSLTSCHVCGAELRVQGDGYYGAAIVDDCDQRRV